MANSCPKNKPLENNLPCPIMIEGKVFDPEKSNL